MTTSGRCFCGEEGREAHHPTASGPNVAHLDPEFTVSTCVQCHRLIHDDYREFDVEPPTDSASFNQIQADQLERMGLTLLRIFEVHPENQWDGAFGVQLRKMAEGARTEARRARQ